MSHMLNLSILISEVSGPGGLFDINATLPIIAIQFLLLMIILNILLYSPLLKIIDERNKYILNNHGFSYSTIKTLTLHLWQGGVRQRDIVKLFHLHAVSY